MATSSCAFAASSTVSYIPICLYLPSILICTWYRSLGVLATPKNPVLLSDLPPGPKHLLRFRNLRLLVGSDFLLLLLLLLDDAFEDALDWLVFEDALDWLVVAVDEDDDVAVANVAVKNDALFERGLFLDALLLEDRPVGIGFSDRLITSNEG